MEKSQHEKSLGAEAEHQVDLEDHDPQSDLENSQEPLDTRPEFVDFAIQYKLRSSFN
jgi:hypothetical protein